MATTRAPARRLKPTPTVSIATVTPAVAEGWLEHNTHNRNIREERVVWLARMILDKDWELTGDSIVFDDQDVLLNGQHRLSAIVAAGKPAQLVVLRGVPSKAQEVMDAVALRHLGDQLKLRGEVNVNTLASALFWLHRFNVIEATNGESGVTRLPAELRPTTRQMFALLDDNPDIRDCVKKMASVRRAIRIRSGIGSACYYKMMQIDAGDCEVFWARLMDGEELKSNNPIYKLRQGFMLQDRSPRERIKDFREAALIFVAWNTWRDGDVVNTKGLRWNWGAQNKEKFPTPK